MYHFRKPPKLRGSGTIFWFFIFVYTVLEKWDLNSWLGPIGIVQQKINKKR